MQKNTLTKEERLRKPEDFQRVKKTGKRHHTGSMVIYVSKNNQGSSRLGLIVSGRVGGAVLRNKIKRSIREFFRLNKEKQIEELDMVFYIKPGKKAKPRELRDIKADLLVFKGKSFKEEKR